MKLDPQLLEFAKTMRHNATDAENLMWKILRAKRFMNLKFRRQHVIAPYIVDFYCHELGLVIELDGSQHNTEDGQAYDCLLYTSPSPRDQRGSRMPSSA